jgi:hypothetical protein
MRLPFDLSELTSAVASALETRAQTAKRQAEQESREVERTRIEQGERAAAERAKQRRVQREQAQQQATVVVQEIRSLRAFLDAAERNDSQHGHGPGCFCARCVERALARMNRLLSVELPSLTALTGEHDHAD